MFAYGTQSISIAGAPVVGQIFATEQTFRDYYFEHVVSKLGISVTRSYKGKRRLRFHCNRRGGPLACPYSIGLTMLEGSGSWVVCETSVLCHNHGPTRNSKNPAFRPWRRSAGSTQESDVSCLISATLRVV